MAKYLEDQRETMVAFQLPDDDYIFGVLYVNKFGGYMRFSGTWVAAAPDDDIFDETYPYYVKPETVNEFLDLFDRGPILVQDAMPYLTEPGSAGKSSDTEDEKSPEDQLAEVESATNEAEPTAPAPGDISSDDKETDEDAEDDAPDDLDDLDEDAEEAAPQDEDEDN